jgi:hypothetical protein
MFSGPDSIAYDSLKIARKASLYQEFFFAFERIYVLSGVFCRQKSFHLVPSIQRLVCPFGLHNAALRFRAKRH